MLEETKKGLKTMISYVTAVGYLVKIFGRSSIHLYLDVWNLQSCRDFAVVPTKKEMKDKCCARTGFCYP